VCEVGACSSLRDVCIESDWEIRQVATCGAFPQLALSNRISTSKLMKKIK
jgi:hypothetical protein